MQPGSVLTDIEDWVRRIIKFPSEQSISSATIQNYINRFYIYDMPGRIQLFELRRQYTFLTSANIFNYQFPFNEYQLIRQPAYCDGQEIGMFIHNDQFYRVFPEFVFNEIQLQGDNTPGPYIYQASQTPILRGFTDDLGNLLPYVFISAVDAGNNQLRIVDDGFGVLNQVDETFQTILTPNVGVVDYITGAMLFSFSAVIPGGNPITVQSSPYVAGRPRAALFFNNIIKVLPVPDRPYKIQFDAQITPAQFLNSNDAVPFSYMSEYISRGAARKILSDNGDLDQFAFYEPLFKEQECQVLRRTNRQQMIVRTPTIFSGVSNTNGYPGQGGWSL